MSNDNFIDSYSIYANRFSFMGRPLTRNPDDADVFEGVAIDQQDKPNGKSRVRIR